MFKKLASICVAGLLSTMTWAAVLDLQPNAPRIYQVKKGDNLWDIAGLYLEKPWLWPHLWRQNSNIEDPNLIYPGDELRLIWHQGQAQLVKTASTQAVEQTPIHGISQAALRQYLTQDILIDKASLQKAPRVLGTQGGWEYISKYTPFFVDQRLETKDWGVYRPKITFTREMDENRTQQMVSLKKVAQAQLVQTLDGISQMQLTEQKQEVRLNDILLPLQNAKTGKIVNPKLAPQPIEGQLIGHLYGSHYVGLKQVVVLDLGRIDGLDVGQIFTVTASSAVVKGHVGHMQYQDKREIDGRVKIKTIALPDQNVASLMIIQTYPHFSLAMVVDAMRPLSAPMKVIAAEE